MRGLDDNCASWQGAAYIVAQFRSLDGEPRLILEYSTVALGKHSALHNYVILGKFGAPHIRPA